MEDGNSERLLYNIWHNFGWLDLEELKTHMSIKEETVKDGYSWTQVQYPSVYKTGIMLLNFNVKQIAFFQIFLITCFEKYPV